MKFTPVITQGYKSRHMPFVDSDLPNEPIAAMGDYCGLKFVQGRKCAQVIIEIPIEKASAFVQAFGTPDSANPVKVAIARLLQK